MQLRRGSGIRHRCVNVSGARPQAGARHSAYRGRSNDVRSVVGGRYKSCENCGYHKHRDKNKCPTWGRAYGNCNKLNHFRHKCKSWEVYTVEVNISEISDNETYFLGTVNWADNTRAWYITLSVCGKAS